MLITALCWQLLLFYHHLTPAMANGPIPHCFELHAPIEDIESCNKALYRIPYLKPDSPFFHKFPLSTTLRSDSCIVEVRRLPGDEVALHSLYTPEIVRDFVWHNVETVVEDIVEFCSGYGGLKGRGAGTMETGIWLKEKWYPYRVIVTGAHHPYKKGAAVIHVNGSPWKVSPPPMFNGSAQRSRT